MAKFTVNNKYGVAPNELLNDKNLSFKAKGLWTYLQSKPDNWDFSAERIAKEGCEGVDSVSSGLKELEKNGYLTRKKFQDEKGHWGIEYILAIKEKISENPNSEIPATENPSQENPSSENILNISKKDSSKKYNSKEINKKEINKKSDSAFLGVFKESDFFNSSKDVFFNHYPKWQLHPRDGKAIKDINKQLIKIQGIDTTPEDIAKTFDYILTAIKQLNSLKWLIGANPGTLNSQLNTIIEKIKNAKNEPNTTNTGRQSAYSTCNPFR